MVWTVKRMRGTAVYVDRYLYSILYSWLMTSLAIWVSSRIAGRALHWRRCLWCGGVGAALMVWIYLSRFGLLPGAAIAAHPLTWFCGGAAMVWLAWRPLKAGAFAALTLRFVLVSSLPVGFVSGVGAILELNRTPMPAWLLASLPPALMLILGELGWGILHKAVYQYALLPVEVVFGDAVVQVAALIDTGNLLTDPVSHSPVVILEMSALDGIIPETVSRAVLQLNAGKPPDLQGENDPWLRRIRLLPYLTIGRDHGMLTGFRPDEVRLLWDGRALRHEKVIVGLYDRPLSTDGSYRALIPPSLLISA